MLMFKRDDWSNRSRFAGLSSLAAPCLAIALCLISAGVVAQTTFDFEDPLEDMRRQIEAAQPQADPVANPESMTETARGQVAEAVASAEAATDGVVAGAQNSAASLADHTGLTKNGLLGLLGLGLLALASLIAWLLFRRREPAPEQQESIYAGGGKRKRRVLDSGAHVVRRKKAPLDTSETPEQAAEAETARAETLAAHTPAQTEGPVAPDPAETVVADNPDTWRRPNLDRLKESIRADWKGESANDEKRNAFESEEAQAFAELFGDDEPAPRPAAQKPAVLDMLDTYDAEPEPLPVSELQQAVKAHTPQIETPEMTRRARASLPSRSEALRRVRALRDSVKAG